MPCFTVRQTKIDLRNSDRDLLRRALGSLGVLITEQDGEWLLSEGKWGYCGRFQPQSGLLTLSAGTGAITEAKVKQAYGQTAVQAAAEKFGWKMASAKKANSYVLSRRK